MGRAKSNAYGRGYNAGARWPLHKPPYPPDPLVRELMESLRELRDTCDAFRATLEQDDPFGADLEPAIDRADAALISVGRWLKELPNDR